VTRGSSPKTRSNRLGVAGDHRGDGIVRKSWSSRPHHAHTIPVRTPAASIAPPSPRLGPRPGPAAPAQGPGKVECCPVCPAGAGPEDGSPRAGPPMAAPPRPLFMIVVDWLRLSPPINHDHGISVTDPSGNQIRSDRKPVKGSDGSRCGQGGLRIGHQDRIRGNAGTVPRAQRRSESNIGSARNSANGCCSEADLAKVLHYDRLGVRRSIADRDDPDIADRVTADREQHRELVISGGANHATKCCQSPAFRKQPGKKGRHRSGRR